MQTCDVLVLGVGGVGAAALDHLARRGLSVIGLDRWQPGHDQGSSHGETRVIRKAYFEHPDYVPLLERAYQLWGELEQDCGQPLFVRCGVLEVGPADGVVVPGVLASAQQHQLAVESLTAAEVTRRYPGFVVPADHIAVFERDAGFLYVERSLQSHVQHAIAAGARLQLGETIRSWALQGTSVEVVTDRETYSADRVVITAGAWAGQLLRDLGVPFQILRKTLYWQRTTDSSYDTDSGVPCFLFETPEGAFYGFPAIDGLGVKAAEHTGGLPLATPEAIDRRDDPGERARLQGFTRMHLPRLSTEVTRFATCFYTMTPDQNFVVDHWPSAPQVVFAAGLSGHGYKFASVLGEVLADLCTSGQTSLPVEFLRADRPGLREPGW